MSVDLIETTDATGDEVPPSLSLNHQDLILCANTTVVLIGRNGRGQWIARERYGLYGGLFVSRDNAVRYALFENGHRPEAIIMVSDRFELDMTLAPLPDSPVQRAA